MTKFAADSSGLLTPLQPWLNDPSVSEILINQPQEVFIEKGDQLTRHAVPDYDVQTLQMLFRLIANENQQALSSRTPLLSGNLLDGSRVQLVMPPTAKHHSLSIRRKVVQKLTLDNYSKLNFYHHAKPFDIKSQHIDNLPDTDKTLLQLYQDQDWDSFIEQAIAFRKNIIISGGTSSGKTTFLNACLQHIDNDERIITLEDTREIDIPHPNQVNLLAPKGNQGLANISMQNLVQCCLRLRPDRIIMGEVRGKEILDFVSACSTGPEGSLTTIHANNPRIAFMRMTQMYKLNNVPAMSDADILNELKEIVDIIVQVAKTPQGRCVQSVYYKYGHVRC